MIVSFISGGNDSDWIYTRTTSKGYYQIYIDPGKYRIETHHESYNPYVSGEIEIFEGENNTFDIILEPLQSGIYGVVTNQDGSPVEDAYVYLTPIGGGYYLFNSKYPLESI